MKQEAKADSFQMGKIKSMLITQMPNKLVSVLSGRTRKEEGRRKRGRKEEEEKEEYRPLIFRGRKQK
jgi:hypothetical protein